jgi:hypothetical protein
LYRIAAYGTNVFAGFVGGKPVFGRDTVWHNPVIESLNEADRIHFDERNPYWRTHLETVDYFSEACAGVEQFGMTDFGGPADWISAMMGTERFLIAAAEEPDRMREFALRLADEYTQAYDVLYPRVTARNDGATNWMPVWTDRRLGTVQDDIAITLSPRMYREIFLPALRRMAAHAEHAILHWHDGCAQHVETMAKTEELDVIQFGHDPNIGPFRKMLPYMKKIQAAGKRLFISCVNAEDVEFFIRNLDPRGLLMIINTENDEASQRMEEDVRLWTRARLREGPPDERTAP